MNDFSMMYDGFDDVEPSYGFSDEPLPSGWYPLVVEKVLDKSLSRNGSPTARIQLLVKEGGCEGKRTFANIIMGPAETGRDKDGNEIKRSPEEMQKTAATIKGQMSGFLRALGVTTGQPQGAGDQAVYNFFNVDSWQGREFMGFVKLMPATPRFPNPSNRLQGYRSLEDEKHGLSAWRAAEAKKPGGGGKAEAKAQSI